MGDAMRQSLFLECRATSARLGCSWLTGYDAREVQCRNDLAVVGRQEDAASQGPPDTHSPLASRTYLG